jgi:hypothetical protein
LSDNNVTSLLQYAKNPDEMVKLIIQYKKELSEDSVYHLLQYASNPAEIAKILGNEKINKVLDYYADYLLSYASNKDEMAKLIAKLIYNHMNFKQWLITEDFKTQKAKFIAQGNDPNIVDKYLTDFKKIKDMKLKSLQHPLPVQVPPNRRNDIDAYQTFQDLEQVVDYVMGQERTLTMPKIQDVQFQGKPVHKDQNLEIYYADSPQACIQIKGNMPYGWCVARNDASNLYQAYRYKEHEPAFYFIKNIQKTKKEYGIWNLAKTTFSGRWNDKWHFFVIQVPNNIQDDPNKQQYFLTSASNDGDNLVSWNQITEIEPLLIPLKHILSPQPLTSQEREDYNRFKNGVDDETFKKLNYREKDKYLDIYVRVNRGLTDAQFENLSPDLKNKYIGFGPDLTDNQFKIVKQDKNLLKRYKDIITRMVENDNAEVRKVVVKYKQLHNFPELMEILVNDSNKDVRYNLTLNQNLTPEVIKKLANDSDDHVRENIAQNKNLTPEVMKIYANDSNRFVRYNLAQNQNLIPELMEKLANDSDPFVRENIAQNQNLIPELMEKLANDSDDRVRQILARNPNLTPEVIKILANDSVAGVRENIAKNPNLTPEVMKILAKDSVAGVREILALNPNLTPEVIKILANDSNPFVRYNLRNRVRPIG